MKYFMFDVDGTLVQSYEFDEECYLASVLEVTGIELVNNWGTYPHVTDSGILQTFIERQARHYSIKLLEEKVKAVFVRKINEFLIQNPAREIEGAISFFEKLKANENVLLSIATGGWLEPAIAKLESAGFDILGIPLASSDDHYSRIEIMKMASSRMPGGPELDFTYFGDAQWDVKACDELGVNLVIVGNRVKHRHTIKDFSDVDDSDAYQRFLELDIC